MKLQHFFMILASLLLPSCSNNTNNSNEKLNDEIVEEPYSLNNNANNKSNTLKYKVGAIEDNTNIDETTIENNEYEQNNKISENEESLSNLLSSYSTKVYTKTAARVGNLDIVCSKIDGYIVEPGEEFSYNTIAGPYNKENGFGKATVFVNGEEVQEYGGRGMPIE